MSNPPPLVDHLGRPFQLEQSLASGGEGAVFSLRHDSSRVAKIYHTSPSKQTVEKLAAMTALANPNLLSLAAWPSGLLHHAKTRQVVGFVMPRLIDCQPIQHLYNPVQRLKFFPRASWAFQARAALNLAAAFDEVHKAGCLVGDVNQSNAQVSPQALVRLIDCDSFQVLANGKQYLCEVGVAHYIPPELQGKPLRGLVRTENHDRFGLAVLIYQLLFVGRHPYSGIYRGKGDPSYEQLIAEFRFSQGPLARTWEMDPPPHTPLLSDVSPLVGDLFRRAFERGSEKGSRPRPSEWHAALKQLEPAIAECSADAGHKYWQGASKCVWCRLSQHGGPEYYYGVDGGGGDFSVDEAKLQEVLKRIASTQSVELNYERDFFRPAKPTVATPFPDDLEDYHSTFTVLGVAVGFCILTLPLGFFHRAFVVFGLLGSLVFGVLLLVLRWMSPWNRELQRRRTARTLARRNLESIETKWQRKVLRYRHDHAEQLEVLHGLVADCRGLLPKYQAEQHQLTANAEAIGRMRHLRLHLLADADIPKIGAGRKQILSSFGIFTAADIDESTIRGIKGFGDTLTSNLLYWRESVLKQFRFDPKTAIPPAEQRALSLKFRSRQNQHLSELLQQLAQIEALYPSCRSSLEKLVPELRNAVAMWMQSKADLDVIVGN